MPHSWLSETDYSLPGFGPIILLDSIRSGVQASLVDIGRCLAPEIPMIESSLGWQAGPGWFRFLNHPYFLDSRP